MIQRIQSYYLLLTTLLSVLFLKGGFLRFTEKSGSAIKITFGEIIRETGIQTPELIDKIFPLSLFIILIPVLSLITIFLFKKRDIQLWLVRILILLVVAFIVVSGFYTYNILTKYSAAIIPGFNMFIPVLQLILSILAFRGIKKDDQLVKSYDRLR